MNKNLSTFIYIILILVIIVANFRNASQDDDEGENSYKYTDNGYANPNCLEKQKNVLGEKQTSRSWIDYHNTDYCMQYATKINDYQSGYNHRANYMDDVSMEQDEFWNRLYQNLYMSNRAYLSGLQDSLWKIKTERDLDRSEFAEMVTSFVQDIPYVYVLDAEKCVDQKEKAVDCLEGERFGILSPIEFLYTLKGDCDTRTVLLYTLFKHFGYHPKIAVSWVYLHSMLLLDVPSPGYSMNYQGENYVFWETTAAGWKSGEIPADMTTVENWKILLH